MFLVIVPNIIGNRGIVIIPNRNFLKTVKRFVLCTNWNVLTARKILIILPERLSAQAEAMDDSVLFINDV